MGLRQHEFWFIVIERNCEHWAFANDVVGNEVVVTLDFHKVPSL